MFEKNTRYNPTEETTQIDASDTILSRAEATAKPMKGSPEKYPMRDVKMFLCSSTGAIITTYTGKVYVFNDKDGDSFAGDVFHFVGEDGKHHRWVHPATIVIDEA